jgi:glycosyltransferase involved in cell wall biosynthesis
MNQQQRLKNSMEPKISVVIPTLNEGKYLAKTLERLRTQEFKEFEVIVVDGGSSDNTGRIAKNYGASLITEPGANVCRARNIGLHEARGQVIVGADADTVYPVNHLSVIWREFAKDPRVVAVTGGWMLVNGPRWAIRMWQLITATISFVYRFSGVVLYAPAFNLAYRRDILLEMGGYDETLDFGGDELDILRRLKKAKLPSGENGKIVFTRELNPKTSGRRYNVGFLTFLTHELIYNYWLNYILRKYFSKRTIRAKPVR